MTSNKIFFDPCKTHPLVKEHGCEEYLLSCSVDNLASVSFFSDISHVHFNTSQQRSAMIHSTTIHTHKHTHIHSECMKSQYKRFFFNLFLIRRKGKKIFQKLKTAKRRAGGLPNQKGESAPALVSVAPSDLSSLALSLTKEVSGEEEEETESRDMAEVEGELDSSPLEVLSEASAGVLGVAVLSSAATFCCGGQEAARKVKTDTDGTSSVKSRTAGTNVKQDLSERWFISMVSFSCLLCLLSVPRRSSAGSLGSLMFVRLRVQPTASKRKGVGGLQLGSAKTLPRRDAWLALSQDRYSN